MGEIMKAALEVIRKYETEIGRLGLGFTLAYAGIQSLLVPENWIGWVPAWIGAIMSREIFLFIHGVLEVGAAAALIFNVGALWGAAFGALNMASIVIIGGVDLVTFRDVGLLALALMLMARLR